MQRTTMFSIGARSVFASAPLMGPQTSWPAGAGGVVTDGASSESASTSDASSSEAASSSKSASSSSKSASSSAASSGSGGAPCKNIDPGEPNDDENFYYYLGQTDCKDG